MFVRYKFFYVLLMVMMLPMSMYAQKSSKSIHQFKIASLNGKVIDFASFKGKYILVVNTASKCGYTKQYKALQELYKQRGKDLVIVGFPSDNFGGQEFDENDEIATFCERNYGVTFPLTTKVNVKGDDVTPIYQFLTDKRKNGVLNATIKWNFNKFLLDKNGGILAYFPSDVTPDSPEILKYLP